MKATRIWRRLFYFSICLAMLLSLLPVLTASAVSPDIVISQVYGGGGNTGSISTSPEVNPAIPTQSTMQSQSSLNASPDGWGWVEGPIDYTYVTGWTGIPYETGFGTYMSYYQNAENGYPFINSIYYIAVTVYGISSPQAGTMSAYITFLLPPNTSLAISSGTPMRCYGGLIPFQEFTCDYSLQQLYPGVNQYAIPSGEYGNVWPIGAEAGWEFLIPVKTSTTLNNSTLWGEITNIDGYQNPPKLYPEVPIYVWEGPAEAPGAFNKVEPVNGATGVEIYPQLSWDESARAASYYYCLDTTNDNTCSNWISETVAVAELLPGTTYYWQIKAVNDIGTTYANGSLSSFWSFTTKTSVIPPGAFNKSLPSDGATGVSNNPTISWAVSSGKEIYQYCYDTSNDNACSSWFSTYATSVTLGGLTSGVKYYWHIRALNYDGTTYSNGSSASYWSFTTTAATIKPGNFNKINPSNGEVAVPTNPTLSWGGISDVISYEYCYDDSDDNACSPWVNNGIITSKSLSGLLPGTTYYWHVRAINNAGTTYANGSEVAFWSFRTALGPPPGAFDKSSPSNGATGLSTTPTLSWGTSSGATSYDYCYDTTNDGACSSWVDNGTVTSTALGGLTTDTIYYWHIRAVNGNGTTYSNVSNTAFWSFKTKSFKLYLPLIMNKYSPPPVSPPGEFNKSSPTNGATGQSTSPTLTWEISSGATSYEYCYDTTNDNACTTWVDNGTATSKALSGLSTGTSYYWHVRSNNSGGTTYANGSSTAFWSFTTVPTLPVAFSKISPTHAATGQSVNPTLTWEISSGATSYEYCYDTTNDNACSTSWVDNGTATSKALSWLWTGTSYYWHVRANNSGGTTYANGDLAFWSFTTGAPPPAPVLNAIINNDGDGTYIVSWSSSPGAISYNLQEDDNEIFSSPTNVFGGATLKEITGKNVGERYYYRVNASNFFGSGNWSNVVSTLLCPHPGIWKGDTSPAGYGIEFQIQSTPSCQIVAGSLKIILGSPFGTITYPNSYNITSSQISFSGNSLQMTGDFTSFTIADGSFSYTGTPNISGLWDANYSP